MAASHLSPLNLALAALAAVPYIVLLVPLYSTPVNAQLIDCYKWDGTISANNTRCPGSNACCGPNSVCLSNRLCTPDRDPTPEGKLVRGPCAVKGWDDSCPQICTYSKSPFPVTVRSGIRAKSDVLRCRGGREIPKSRDVPGWQPLL